MADRIEREIEDILRKIDDFVPDNGRPRRPPRKTNSGITNAQGWLARRLSKVSLNQVMLWSMIIVFAAFFFRGIPGASWVLIGGLIVLATAFILSLRAPSARPAQNRRWRGEPVDYSSGPKWPDRLKARLKGRKKT